MNQQAYAHAFPTLTAMSADEIDAVSAAKGSDYWSGAAALIGGTGSVARGALILAGVASGGTLVAAGCLVVGVASIAYGGYTVYHELAH